MRSNYPTPPTPLDENIMRTLLMREAERVTPRADAQARFLAAVEEVAEQESRQRKPLGWWWRWSRALEEHLVRAACALPSPLP